MEVELADGGCNDKCNKCVDARQTQKSDMVVNWEDVSGRGLECSVDPESGFVRTIVEEENVEHGFQRVPVLIDSDASRSRVANRGNVKMFRFWEPASEDTGASMELREDTKL